MRRIDELTLNELAKALAPLLPDGWDLRVTFRKDEISVDLHDPEDRRQGTDWPDDITTNELALWLVNFARSAEGMPPGEVPGIRYFGIHSVTD